jgi:hypothetical protein
VTRNFDVVYTYNAAESYTLAACVFSDRLGGGRGIVTPWPTDDLLLSRDGRKELQVLLQRRGYDIGGDPDGHVGTKSKGRDRRFPAEGRARGQRPPVRQGACGSKEMGASRLTELRTALASLRSHLAADGGSTMKINLLMAGAVYAAMSFSAHAATIERTFDVEASGFFLADGSSDPAPVDPVTLNFTLMWDPSAVTDPTASGLTVNSFSLPYSSVFASDAAGNIALGRNLISAVDCLTGGGLTYCLFMSNSTSDNPTAVFDQFTSDGEWVAGSVTVTASSLAAPESSTWALMLVGFGGVGWLTSRRRRVTANAA